MPQKTTPPKTTSRNRAPVSRAAASLPLPDLQALADFEPSAAQRAFVELAIGNEKPLRISAACQELGISRSTYYRWLDDPRFRGWMALQWATALLGDGGRLLSIARVRAESDFRYFKSLLELVFDPRGLGLLATWQRRMAAPVIEEEPLEPEPPDPGTDRPSLGAQTSPAASEESTAPAQSTTAPSLGPHTSPAAATKNTGVNASATSARPCSSSLGPQTSRLQVPSERKPPQPTPVPPLPDSTPMKSTTSSSATLQNPTSSDPKPHVPATLPGEPREAPDHRPWLPAPPPAWPNSTRFR